MGGSRKNPVSLCFRITLLENGNVKYNLGDTITLQLGKRCSVDENGNVQMQYELSQNNPFSDEEKLVPERTIEYTL